MPAWASTAVPVMRLYCKPFSSSWVASPGLPRRGSVSRPTPLGWSALPDDMLAEVFSSYTERVRRKVVALRGQAMTEENITLKSLEDGGGGCLAECYRCEDCSVLRRCVNSVRCIDNIAMRGR